MALLTQPSLTFNIIVNDENQLGKLARNSNNLTTNNWEMYDDIAELSTICIQNWTFWSWSIISIADIFHARELIFQDVDTSLTHANEVGGKVMLLHLPVPLSTGDTAMPPMGRDTPLLVYYFNPGK